MLTFEQRTQVQCVRRSSSVAIGVLADVDEVFGVARTVAVIATDFLEPAQQFQRMPPAGLA